MESRILSSSATTTSSVRSLTKPVARINTVAVPSPARLTSNGANLSPAGRRKQGPGRSKLVRREAGARAALCGRAALIGGSWLPAGRRQELGDVGLETGDARERKGFGVPFFSLLFSNRWAIGLGISGWLLGQVFVSGYRIFLLHVPIDSNLLKLLIPVGFCHALGHVTSNVSFAAVAVSFTLTIKALEPFFNAAASQFILGQSIPITLCLSLAPVVIGVSMASLTELSFNWLGFTSAMISNISFTYRSIYSKKAMTDMDSSTNLYAYISIIALLFCIPPAVILEGPQLLKYGLNDAIA
ncbi:hypothetical protein R6Q59_028123 [Mikania micrantha]